MEPIRPSGWAYRNIENVSVDRSSSFQRRREYHRKRDCKARWNAMFQNIFPGEMWAFYHSGENHHPAEASIRRYRDVFIFFGIEGFFLCLLLLRFLFQCHRFNCACKTQNSWSSQLIRLTYLKATKSYFMEPLIILISLIKSKITRDRGRDRVNLYRRSSPRNERERKFAAFENILF